MRIIHIAVEFAPFAKVGGMADMIYGLAMAQKDDDIQILLPNHSSGDLSVFDQISDPINLELFSYQKATYKNLSIVLFQTSQNDFKREHVYGYADDVARYLRFSLVCHQFLKGQKNIIAHLHDWHAAFFAFLNQKEHLTLFTIHNLAYTGAATLTQLLPYASSSELSCLKEGNSYHLLKAGILFADRITTVSPTYTQEILHNPSLLQSALKKNANKLSGIINGIDTDYWNPATDPHLSLNYDTSTLSKKEDLKRLIKKHFGIEEKKGFVVAIVARLVYQKGPEYILEAMKIVQQWGGGCILLGSCEDESLMQKFFEVKNISTYLSFTYNETAAHLAFAAADLFLMPSIFEPCGLTQLIAMHYGTLPLVSRTGGLCDTVEEGKTGFFFENQNHRDLKEKLLYVLDLWEKNPDKWKEMQINAMKKDVSWAKSVKEYNHLYSAISETYSQQMR